MVVLLPLEERREQRRNIPFRTKLWGYIDFYLHDGKNVYRRPDVYDAVVNGWLGRENLARGVADVIQTHVAGVSLLELGAGSGALTLELAERKFAVTAVDIERNALDELINKANQRLGRNHFIATVHDTINQRHWGFASDGSFDGVVTLRCNRYIRDFEGFLQEACRALRPGGVIVFPVFALDMPTWPLHSRRRIFQKTTPFFIRRALRGAGFRCVSEGRYFDLIHQNRVDFVPIFYRPFFLVYRKPE